MSRRASGEGSIYKRADGRWAASYEAGWKDGKRVRKAVYGATQREVQQKLQAVRRTIEAGVAPPPERETVAMFLTDWLEIVRPTVRPGTWDRYRDVVHVHLIPGLGKIRLARLTPQDVEKFIARKLIEPRRRQPGADLAIVKPLSPRTVQEIRTVLVGALNTALRKGQIIRNSAALTVGPDVPEVEVQPFTPAEARRFLEEIRGNRHEALYVVAMGLGLRQGEALGLTWREIDFDTAVVRVNRALKRIPRRALYPQDPEAKGREYRLDETKTKKGRRSLAMPGFVAASLREHRIRQLEERLAAGKRWDDSWELVFCTPTGTPLHGPHITESLKMLLKQAGLPAQRFHDLRHACGSLLLAQGVALKTISELLGHSAIHVTANRYVHIMDDLKRDAAGRMDALFASPVDDRASG